MYVCSAHSISNEYDYQFTCLQSYVVYATLTDLVSSMLPVFLILQMYIRRILAQSGPDTLKDALKV